MLTTHLHTFHFPEQMINYVTSDVKDKESLCPEYKVEAVENQRASAEHAFSLGPLQMGQNDRK